MIASTHKSRETGTNVTVGNSIQDGWETDADSKWYTFCEAHDFIVFYPTLSAARSWASEPTSWCAVCQHEFKHVDKPEWGCFDCDNKVDKS